MQSELKYKEIFEMPARLYAIGDVHACLNEISLMLEFLENKENFSDADLLVFIGDYIDRGSESRTVLECLIEFKKRHGNTIFLRGNHEEMLLSFLGFAGTNAESYLYNGGTDFLSSYGLFSAPTREEILIRLPPAHISFLLSLDSYLIVDKYVFVHAGLNPLRPLRAQLDQDIYWIRDEFILNVHHFDKTVVFGHTPYKDILLHLPYKIGIDTGLVYGNLLTCIELTQNKIFQIERGGSEVSRGSF